MANGDVLSGTSWPACFGEEPDYVLVKNCRITSADVANESITKAGAFYGGRKKRTRVDVVVEVELLEGGQSLVTALQGTGVGAEDDARIEKVELGSDSEGAPTATITGFYCINTAASYVYEAPVVTP